MQGLAKFAAGLRIAVPAVLLVVPSCGSTTTVTVNHDRLHEALGDIPPAEIDALYARRTETVAR